MSAHASGPKTAGVTRHITVKTSAGRPTPPATKALAKEAL
jgi:hypothetical protein